MFLGSGHETTSSSWVLLLTELIFLLAVQGTTLMTNALPLSFILALLVFLAGDFYMLALYRTQHLFDLAHSCLDILTFPDPLGCL